MNGRDGSPSLADFYRGDSDDLFDKCRRFSSVVSGAQLREILRYQYRLILEGPLDHRVRVRDPMTGTVKDMLCFDSSSYFGLQLHPRVMSAVRQALDDVGCGTPSIQILGGTNRYLQELEDTVSAFHGREAALIFSSGYAANVGILTGLLREDDFVARDRLSHASLQDGCRWSGARFGGSYANRDMNDLERLFAEESEGAHGKLIASDGIFSLHGCVAPLPQLHAIADRHQAYLMVDDAVGVGAIGATGGGIEEHFQMKGAVDILMGSFTKVSGCLGGYVCGSRDLITYLRFFARSSVFTASLPAALCAGVTESFRVFQGAPEYRVRLWENARRLWKGLHEAGFVVPELESPILTVFMGTDRLLWAFNRQLFDAGLKCAILSHPAVPKDESAIRFTVTSRHTSDDLDRAVEAMARTGKQFGILHRSPEEIRSIGERLTFPSSGAI